MRTAVIGVTVLLMAVGLASAQTSLSLVPDKTCLDPNEILTVSITLTTTVTNMTTGSFNLTYAPATLAYVNGSFAIDPSTVWDLAFIGTVDTVNGKLTSFGVQDFSPYEGGQGSGVMATLQFQALAPICSTAGLVDWQASPASSLLDANGVVYSVANSNLTTTQLPAIAVDNVPPTFVPPPPPNLTVPAAPGLCSATVSWTAPTATDNCPGVSVAQTGGPPSGSTFPVGTQTITYTATDACGNTANVSFTVTVQDTQIPLISGCPGNISKNTDPGLCTAVATWTPPTASDNCPGVTIAQTAGLPPGSAFPKGVTTVTYTATDASGNFTTCTFTVTVTDAELPVILGCPSNITTNTDPNKCTAVVTWTPPTATDNCPGVVITRTAGPAPGSTFNKGATTVTYTATDTSGNTAVCTFTVTVVDAQPPQILNCPNPPPPGMIFPADPNCAATVTWAAPTVADNCPGATISQTAGPPPGSYVGVGSYTVIYTALDTAVPPNVTQCQFTVIVQDQQAPTIIGCPANISVSTDPGVCSAVVSWTAPTATDNCPGVTMTQTAGPPSGSAFPVGTTTVTYTATEGGSLTSTCTFTVTVTDNENPIVTNCPSSFSQPTDPGQCTAFVSWANPVATDNCGVVSFVSNYPNGAAYAVGVYNVTVQAVDAAGNQSDPNTCMFTITVYDGESPTLTPCPADITVETCDPNGATATWTPPTASDNCGVTLTSTHNPGALFPVGTTTVTYTATDGVNPPVTCSFNVSVGDFTPPTVTFCPPAPAVLYSCNSIDVDWQDAVASDACGLLSDPNFALGVRYLIDTGNNGTINARIKVSHRSFSPGTHRVWVQVADINGNVFPPESGLDPNDPNQCTFLVTVSNDIDVVVTLNVEGLGGGSVTRCVDFHLGNTVSGTYYTVADKLLTFSNGVWTGSLLALDPALPCNEAWNCLAAEDSLHTLRSRVGVSPVGDPNVTGQFSASFVGPFSLQQGDLLDDGVINAIDAGLYVIRLNSSDPNLNAPGANSPCSLPTGQYHADFDGDGLVTIADFGPYTAQPAGNYGMLGLGLCNDPNNTSIREFVDDFTYEDLIAKGVAELILVDVTRDGILNREDITAVMGGVPIWVRGDANADGRVDFTDIDAMAVALESEKAYYEAYPDGFWYTADANADGRVDALDVDAFIALLQSR